MDRRQLLEMGLLGGTAAALTGCVIEKFLPAKTRMNRHNKHHIAKCDHLFNRFNRRFRVQTNTDSYSERPQIFNKTPSRIMIHFLGRLQKSLGKELNTMTKAD